MNIYEKLGITSNVTIIIISIALMLASGFLMTRLTKKLKLPNVTAYIITGMILGPFVLNLVPSNIIKGMDFLSDIALAFIAFSMGEFFKFSVLKKNGGKVFVITLFETIITSILIFIVTFFVLHMNIAFAIVLSALAAATAPTSTVMTIRQTGAKGDFVNILLEVIALDEIIGLLAYSIAISVALSLEMGGAFSIGAVIEPLAINIGVIIMGALFGLLLKVLLTSKRSTDNRLIVSIAILFLFCGICSLLDISPLLGCMSMGTIYYNISNDDKLFKQLNYFSPPILLLFFVRSGLNFRLDALFDSSMAIAGISLLAIGVIFFFVRMVGKYGGAFLGCLTINKPKEVRNNLGLALFPQGGVAIGLAAVASRALPTIGSALETIIIASSFINEIIGPACAKASLYLSKSYSNKLEEITDINATSTDGTSKSQVQILIERINKIQEQLPKFEENLNEEENAFTEAAEEYYLNNTRRAGVLRNRR